MNPLVATGLFDLDFYYNLEYRLFIKSLVLVFVAPELLLLTVFEGLTGGLTILAIFKFGVPSLFKAPSKGWTS